MARTKICGLRKPADVQACIDHGAAFIGFVDFAKSPRHIEPPDAEPLLAQAQGHATRVLLSVNPADERLAQWLALEGVDMIQLHGTETPQRVAAIKALTGKPVMKAVGISGPKDIDTAIDRYGAVSDWLLFDAKPPATSDRPGGNAHSFDWSLLARALVPVPWMLAGGITAQTVAQAIRSSHARVIDLSSAVESSRGVKDAAKIAEFLKAVEAAG